MNRETGRGVEGPNRFEKRPKAEEAEQEEAATVKRDREREREIIFIYIAYAYLILCPVPMPDKVLHFVNVNCERGEREKRERGGIIDQFVKLISKSLNE